jgi:O-antigen/teichoic acid export membrane protein
VVGVFAFRRILPSPFVANVAKLTSATGAIQFIGIAAAPLTARVFDPATVGACALFSSIVGIMAVASSLRLDQAVPLPKHSHERLAVVALCLCVAAVTISILGLGFAFVGSSLNETLGLGPVEKYAWLLLPAVALIAMSQILTSWSVREGGFGEIARSRLQQSVGQTTYQLGAGVLSGGHVVVMLTAGLVGNVLFLRRLGGGLGRDFVRALRAVTFADVRKSATTYRRFAIYNSWSAILDLTSVSLPILAVSRLFGPTETGLLRMASLLTVLPVTALSSSVAAVYWNNAASQVHDQIPTLSRRHLRLTCAMGMTGIGLVLLSFSLPSVVPLVFGDRWADAGHLAILLSMSAACGLAVSPLDTLAVLGFNSWEAAWITTRLATLCGVVWAAQRASLGLESMVAVLVLTQVVFYLLLFALNRIAFRRAASSWSPQW